MTKKLTLLTILPLSVCILASCNQPEKRYKVEEIFPYVFELDTYRELDYEFADKFYEKEYNNWSGGCSAIAKEIDGHMIVGRNMDLNISNKAAYIVRTSGIGNQYDTIGLAYTFRDVSPDYLDAKQNGITEKFHKLLPFMCDDVMNTAGLYIEINMRNAECWPSGEDKFSSSPTRVEKNLYMFELPRYVAQNCATVSEALTYISNLNLWNKHGYWSYSFLIADAQNNCALVEFAMDRQFRQNGEFCHTNFYINEECFNMEKIRTGLGRYSYMMEHIGEVDSKDKMFQLMDDVSYYQVYYPDECKFDPRSEIIALIPQATYEYVFDERNQKEIHDFLEYQGVLVNRLTRQQQRDANSFWESTFTEVADCFERNIKVRFYENDDYVTTIAFNKN